MAWVAVLELTLFLEGGMGVCVGLWGLLEENEYNLVVGSLDQTSQTCHSYCGVAAVLNS